jgi:hypothetical protein
LRELRRFVVRCRTSRGVAGLGGGPADDHAVQMIVIDDEQPRRRPRFLLDEKTRIGRESACLFEHPTSLAMLLWFRV